MNCVQLEALLCDYLDGTLAAAGRAEVAIHLEGCPACAGLAHDAGAALSFMDRVADVDPPPELLTRILNETASGRHGQLAVAGGLRGWINSVLSPVLQPRLVMGMALTILSFSMMAKCAGVSPRQLRPSIAHADATTGASTIWPRNCNAPEPDSAAASTSRAHLS